MVGKADQALWATELTAAIGVAINYVPAVPLQSEVERLRVSDPNATGPATEPPRGKVPPRRVRR